VQRRLSRLIHFAGGNYTFYNEKQSDPVSADSSATERADTTSKNKNRRSAQHSKTLDCRQPASYLELRDKAATSNEQRQCLSLPTDIRFEDKKDSDNNKQAKSDNGENSDHSNGRFVSCEKTFKYSCTHSIERLAHNISTFYCGLAYKVNVTGKYPKWLATVVTKSLINSSTQ
jgi:hypothetical protein